MGAALVLLWTSSMTGCGDEPSTPMGDGSGDGATTSATASASASVSASGDDGSSAAASGDDGSSAADSSAGTGEDDTTASTGDEPSSDMEICEIYCAWEVGCDPRYPMDECMDDCLYNLGVFDAIEECDAAVEEIFACVADFDSCEPTNISPECLAADEMVAECDDQFTCSSGISVPLDGSGCTVTSICNPSDPDTLEMECDTETCTCIDNGEITGECPVEDVCMADPLDPIEFDEMVTVFVEQCCGWEDFGDPGTPGG